MPKGRTRLARRRSFTCTHPQGKSFTPKGLGHLYDVEVYVEGEIAADSGMILNVNDVDEVLAKIVSPLEAGPLEPRLQSRENLALHLLEQTREALGPKGVDVAKLRLYEGEDLWVDAWPE